MTRAADLFEMVQAGGLAAVERLVADQTFEELFLEFKTVRTGSGDTRLHDHDRNHYRKAVCGFANSEGGVIVWGIDCRDVGAGDVAQGFAPVENPRRFASWLEGATSACTVPPVPGVRSTVIEASQGSGFVVTYIPQSTTAPHQMAGEGRYIIRAGSDFVPAPHGVVAGLFGKPPHPSLGINFISHTVSPTADDGVELNLTFMLVNLGQVVCEDVFLSLFVYEGHVDGQQAVAFEGVANWPKSTGVGVATSWMCPPDFRLAPSGLVRVGKIRLIVVKDPVRALRWQYVCGARGTIPETSVQAVPLEQLKVAVSEARTLAGSASSNHMSLVTATAFGIRERIAR